MSAEESISRSGTSHSGAALPYDYGYGDKKLNLEKCQGLMEILKNFLGGKPTSTVMSLV